MTKAIVLVSGGLDSTVALWWARNRKWETIPLTFNYFARPEAEKSATKAVLRKARITNLIELPLDFMMDADDLALDNRRPRRLRDAPEGYVPARNMIFYSIAASYSEVIDANFIIGGHNKSDPKEFSDSSPSFFRQLDRLLVKGLWSYARGSVKILTPLRNKTKLEVVRLGLKLGAPMESTWSCHFDGERPCGRCSSCVERDEAFRSLGLPSDR